MKIKPANNFRRNPKYQFIHLFNSRVRSQSALILFIPAFYDWGNKGNMPEMSVFKALLTLDIYYNIDPTTYTITIVMHH